MTAQYVADFIITLCTLAALSALVYANGRIESRIKHGLYLAYAIIGVSVLWEALAVYLNGAPSWTYALHVFSKCMDYSITPVCSVAFVRQIAPGGKSVLAVKLLLIGNVLLQIVSAFTGWIYYVDAENYYHHGPLYMIYAVIFCIAAAFVLWKFWQYGKLYPRSNRFALITIAFLILLGIVLQEIIGNGVRTAYLSLAISSALLFIHFTEFSQVRQDTAIREQREQLDTDPLTGIPSRFAYKQTLESYEKADTLPDNLVAMAIDLNGLKYVNDTFGHEAGDRLLRAAGEVIRKAVGERGNCFRTGGDEFVILMTSGLTDASETESLMHKYAESWSSENSYILSFSIGKAAAAEYPGSDIVSLLHEADTQMYADKERYYSLPENERRRRTR